MLCRFSLTRHQSHIISQFVNRTPLVISYSDFLLIIEKNSDKMLLGEILASETSKLSDEGFPGFNETFKRKMTVICNM